MANVKLLLLLIGFVAITVVEIVGHGMMLEPINRSSIWRRNASFPINYQDNQNFCGGFYVSTSHNIYFIKKFFN